MSGRPPAGGEIILGPWRVRPAPREIEGPRGTTRVKPKSMEVTPEEVLQVFGELVLWSRTEVRPTR